ncbi:hypothetical protein G7072_01895 [Nocardioides sp. HDW12B]|uniref:hypothetical protein n=1 Tax=Nocardioides sp. HDW12B TaxID=2714939 RepID=UPI0014090F73|nr:hypothetical protein [Nocardioides sp. HDW12B]QIK65256.1 hypothetical protein G7072_01895 [Nocardioides sp. HDW12B]
MQLPESTIDDEQSSRQTRTSVVVRRVVLSFFLLVLVAGAVGVLGVHTTTASNSEAGWTLELEYAEVARGGLDVPWEVTVERQGGFTGPITLAVDGAYFDIYETQAFHPQPSAMMRDGSTMFLEFDPPLAGETFVVAYDAYIQPGSQIGSTATVAVLDGEVQVAPVEFSTRLLP